MESERNFEFFKFYLIKLAIAVYPNVNIVVPGERSLKTSQWTPDGAIHQPAINSHTLQYKMYFVSQIHKASYICIGIFTPWRWAPRLVTRVTAWSLEVDFQPHNQNRKHNEISNSAPASHVLQYLRCWTQLLDLLFKIQLLGKEFKYVSKEQA